MRRVTIPRLAAAAGVSVSTVNRVLSGKVEVRPETARHVLSVAEQLGFYGTGTIRSRLKQNVPPLHVGLLLQQESMPFHRELAHRFRAQAESREEMLLIPHVRHMEELDPLAVAASLRELGEQCDAVALSVADHTAVNRVVDELTDAGKFVFAAVSDLSATSRAGY